MQKTPPGGPKPKQFVLHLSVAAAWWFSFLPYALEASKFLEELDAGQIRVEVVAETPLRVLARLEAFSRDHPELHLDLDALQVSRTNIATRFRMLAGEGVLHEASRRPLLDRLAWGVHVRFGVSFPDAWSVVLAEMSEIPILVSDAELQDKLKTVESERPDLRVVSLHEYQDP